MKIAIISDVHNNEVNLKKVLDFCARESAGGRIETIICCGDLASKDALDFLCDNFSGTSHYTFGNMDNDQLTNEICHPERTLSEQGESKGKLKDLIIGVDSSTTLGTTCVYKNTVVYRNFGEAEIDGKKIAFVHYPDVARKLCERGKYSFVFYGHTHKPWEEKVGGCKMLNPGNVAGEIYSPTFATWNTATNKFSLIRIHSLK